MTEKPPTGTKVDTSLWNKVFSRSPTSKRTSMLDADKAVVPVPSSSGVSAKARKALVRKMEVAKMPDFSHLLPSDYRRGYEAWRKGHAKGSKGEPEAQVVAAGAPVLKRGGAHRGSSANLFELQQQAQPEVAFWGTDLSAHNGRQAHAYAPSVEDTTHPSGAAVPAATKTKQILIIYTGGTIGMVATPNGYDVLAGYLADQLRVSPRFNSGGDGRGQLALARSPRGYRVEYSIYEYATLLDSSNITVRDWIRIARDIEEAYDLYDGFIVLHGTDTMAYTASVRVVATTWPTDTAWHPRPADARV